MQAWFETIHGTTLVLQVGAQIQKYKRLQNASVCKSKIIVYTSSFKILKEEGDTHVPNILFSLWQSWFHCLKHESGMMSSWNTKMEKKESWEHAKLSAQGVRKIGVIQPNPLSLAEKSSTVRRTDVTRGLFGVEGRTFRPDTNGVRDYEIFFLPKRWQHEGQNKCL